MANILPPDDAALDRVAAALKAGDAVALPTETVYGLAANAQDETACARIFTLKGRPRTDPLIVHVADLAAAEQLAELNTRGEALLKAFWPGPLTLVLPKREKVPDVVTAGGPTVALRSPGHALFREILARTGLPLAAPSANPFGGVSPTTAAHVQAGLGDRIEIILDGGVCGIGIESTVVAVLPGEPVRLLRPGGIDADRIATVLGEEVLARPAVPREGALPSPGMLPRHYAPKTALRLIPHGSALPGPSEHHAVVAFRRPAEKPPAHTSWLSESGDPAEAARHLYRVLRMLEENDYPTATIELAPDGGLGAAINDRLRRAATPA